MPLNEKHLEEDSQVPSRAAHSAFVPAVAYAARAANITTSLFPKIIVRVKFKIVNLFYEPWGFGVLGFWGFGIVICDCGLCPLGFGIWDLGFGIWDL